MSNPEIREQTPQFSLNRPLSVLSVLSLPHCLDSHAPNKKGENNTNNTGSTNKQTNKQTKQQAELCTARNIW